MADQTALVTGASSGIGAACARSLAAAGYHVHCVARRSERVQQVADEVGGTAHTVDVSDLEQVRALATSVDALDVLVNGAGGALGLEPVEETDPQQWRTMYESNVLGTVHCVQALLPSLRRAPSGTATIVNIGSTAGHSVYEGGSGYTAAKHAVTALTQTLRLELVEEPIRVSEVAPGLVATEEFSLVRFGGDAERASKVYEGVREPLVAEDIADVVQWIVTRPRHVNIDLMVVRPRVQAANHKLYRDADPH